MCSKSILPCSCGALRCVSTAAVLAHANLLCRICTSRALAWHVSLGAACMGTWQFLCPRSPHQACAAQETHGRGASPVQTADVRPQQRSQPCCCSTCHMPRTAGISTLCNIGYATAKPAHRRARSCPAMVLLGCSWCMHCLQQTHGMPQRSAPLYVGLHHSNGLKSFSHVSALRNRGPATSIKTPGRQLKWLQMASC